MMSRKITLRVHNYQQDAMLYHIEQDIRDIKETLSWDITNPKDREKARKFLDILATHVSSMQMDDMNAKANIKQFIATRRIKRTP